MDSLNNHCSNCQLLEKKILETNSSVKKLLSLKSKIINTDTLIRKYKEQKDEAEKLAADKQQVIEEREKSERLCTKYEIDLKLALEEVHSLRQCEKEYKSAASRFETEITTLRDNLQAEKALVKQYKSLVEIDEKTDEQSKDKAVKELEKKISKKDDEIQKSRERTRGVSKKLSLISKSHVKALKFIQKLGNHPALQGLLPAGDKRSLNNFCDALNETSLLRQTADNQSEDEGDEFLDESQYLENLLMESASSESVTKDAPVESIPNGHCGLETEITLTKPSTKHIQHDALDSTTDISNHKGASAQKSVSEQATSESRKEMPVDVPEVLEKSSILSSETDEAQCDSPDSTSPLENILFARNMPVLPMGNGKDQDRNAVTKLNNSDRNMPVLPTGNGKEQDQNAVTKINNNNSIIVQKKTTVVLSEISNLDTFKDSVPVVSQPAENEDSRTSANVAEDNVNKNTCSGSNNSSSFIHHNIHVPVPMETDSSNKTIREPSVSSDFLTTVDSVGESVDEKIEATNNSLSVQGDSDNCPMEVEPCANDLTNKTVPETHCVPNEICSEVNSVLDHVVNSASNLVCTLKNAADKEDKESVLEACEIEVEPVHSDLTNRDDVNMSNAESEYEEGELVIASDSEPTATEKTAAEDSLLTDNGKQIMESPASPDRSEEECVTECPVILDDSLPSQVSTNVCNNESTTSGNTAIVHQGSTEFTLPLIPFSTDRQFKPTKSAADASALFKDGGSNSSCVNQNDDALGNKRSKKPEKSKRDSKKVNKICSRMKNAVVLDSPVSPLPPSPPSTPLEATPSKSFLSEIPDDNVEVASKERRESISELFGSDSEEESQTQTGKSLLQHQESEGFEPESEHQDERMDNSFRKHDTIRRREILRRAANKSNEIQLVNSGALDRSSGDESMSGREARDLQVNKRHNQFQGNTRFLSDFSMDPESGRCKISIQLPDNIKSAANVRFEMDTLSKQIHLDYGPSPFKDWKECRQSHTSRNSNSNNKHPECCSPTVTLPDDTPRQLRPAISPPDRCTIEEENSSSNHRNSDSPFSQGRVVRRASVPPIGHALQRLAQQRRVVTFVGHEKEDRSFAEKNNSQPVLFKTPALRKQSAPVTSKNTCSKVIPASVDANISAQNQTTETNGQPQELGKTPANDGTSTDVSSNESNSSPQTDGNVPKSRKGKRKNKSSVRPNDTPKKMSGVSSDIQAHKNFKGQSPLQLPANPKILKTLRMLLYVKMNNESNNNTIFRKVFKNLCSATLCPKPEDLVNASLVFFSTYPVNMLTYFAENKDSQAPLLTAKEEVFVALIKHLQDKQAHLANVICHFLAVVSTQMNQANASPTGLASLCRLHTVLCRQEGYVQMSQDLCYHLVLRKHPHAAFLIANVLVVWPTILELFCSPAHWSLRKKIFSLFLFGNQSEMDDLTSTVLKEVGKLQYSKEDCVPDSLAMEMVSLLTQNDDLRGNEDVCQQLLLMSYMQGWPWTKEKVLPSILAVFESASGRTKAPVIRLIGSFLQYCGPGSKEESDFLVQKLETKFKELDDDDFLPKEACTHSLLRLTGQLDKTTLSQMRSWLQNHRDKLSPHLREDFISSGFLT